MSLAARIGSILSAPRPGAAPRVHTSDAFAARFQAEARRSGLELDLDLDRAAGQVQQCPTCGAQNSRLVRACFNCQTELDGRPVPEPLRASRHAAPEVRWRHIAASPRPSRLPLRPKVVSTARFERAVPAAHIAAGQVMGRFLEVFVERERRRPPPPSVARFDQRTVLERFLSVFVERRAAEEPAPEGFAPGALDKVLSLFVERK